MWQQGRGRAKNFDIKSADFYLLCTPRALRLDRFFDFCICFWSILIQSLFIQLRNMEHVYCKSKIYSHSSSSFPNAFLLVQGKGLLEVTTYELSASECHLNSGLLKGDLLLFLRCFCLFEIQSLTNKCASYSSYCLISLLVYWFFLIFTIPLFCEVWVGWGELGWWSVSWVRWIGVMKCELVEVNWGDEVWVGWGELGWWIVSWVRRIGAMKCELDEVWVGWCELGWWSVNWVGWIGVMKCELGEVNWGDEMWVGWGELGWWSVSSWGELGRWCVSWVRWIGAMMCELGEVNWVISWR